MTILEYPNVPKSIGAVLSTGRVSLRDLDEWYSIEDVYTILEVVTVDAHNTHLLNEARERQRGER